MRIGLLEVLFSTGLVLGRGTALLRTVRLGGPLVPKVRGNAVHMYRDASVAPLLDLRRRQCCGRCVWWYDSVRVEGFTLAPSLELSAQWNCILRVGLVHPVSA